MMNMNRQMIVKETEQCKTDRMKQEANHKDGVMQNEMRD